MCGIAGSWRLAAGANPEADLGAVTAMLAAGAHRGPDGAGSWQQHGLVLGHRRLSILDPAARSAQPMHSGDGASVLVYNGETYNYRELRRELEAEGICFRTRGDAEVVVEALQHWGPARAVPRFNGMFALAWYDRRQRQLWLARDRLGIKPLSVAHHDGRLLFASEDKMLLAVPGFPATIDSREATLRLAGQNRESAASLFTAIRRLPPAALWCIDERGIDEQRWWDALAALDVDRLLSGASTVQELERLLAASVAMHCEADVPLATACSGGIDSGLVTTLAARYRQPLQAYVIAPDTGPSEVAAARLTADAAGVPLRTVALDRASYAQLWPRAVWHMEGSGWSASGAALLALAQRCRDDGVKVLLTGEGADELFGGYRQQRSSAARFAAVSGWRGLLRGPRSRRGRLERLLAAPLERSAGKGSLEERMAMLRAVETGAGFLQQEIFTRLAPVQPLTDRAFLAACLYDLHAHLQDLLHRHDRLSMAASVELRVPFIENALIDFALHVPRADKWRDGQSKWLLRQAARRQLPPAIVTGRKQGFPVSPDYSRGSEALLGGGLLRELMRWSTDETRALQALAATDTPSRLRLAGMELFMRLYAGGERADALAGRLLAAAPRG